MWQAYGWKYSNPESSLHKGFAPGKQKDLYQNTNIFISMLMVNCSVGKSNLIDHILIVH